MEKMTDRQKKYIQELREMSVYSLPQFKGTTKQEANNYIKQYEKLAYESAWAITRGY